MTVRYHRDRQIGAITIDNPPVNALSQAVRAGLLEALDQFLADADAGAGVILCAGRTWIAGADITEFGKPPEAPFLTDVVAAIEAAPKPLVAAIHGTALGGGLELALGAHHRVADANARLGLPEVTLGLLPGAGGTQRLPRLVGFAPALDMITSGRPLGAAEARELGLVDSIADGNLTEAALAAAAALTGRPPRRTRDLPAPPADAGAAEATRQRLSRSAAGQVAPMRVVDLMAHSMAMPFDQGITAEREAFLDLMQGPQRAAMIHAFFAERAVAHLPDLKGVAPRAVDQVGVVGGGTMGTGIAVAALLAGLDVKLVEQDQAAADKAAAAVAGLLEGSVRRGKLSAGQRDAILSGSFHPATGYDSLSGADLIIEAVFEKLEVKRQVFEHLDAVARPGAVLATNTSYLDVNRIAEATRRPHDVIGLHFFSPAHVMRLLEVVVADRTAPDATATAFALAKRLRKIAVRAGVCDGFIGNRILSHCRAAADAMVLDGASPYQIDRALTDFGLAMGPYAVVDLAGLDIGFFTRQRKAASRDPRDRVPVFADRLYEMGRLGRKTGRGYYLYDADARAGREDPELDGLLRQVRADLGLTPRDFEDDEIVARYLAAMVNEGAKIVADGTAARPLDVDVVLLNGYGFPRWRGGPMHWADAQGLPAILADIERFAREDDHFWRAAPLLRDLVGRGGLFADLNKGG